MNPHASERTRRLLDLLTGLPGRAEKRVLSGQFVRWCDTAGFEEFEGIQRKSGHWLAIAGGDYYRNDQKHAHAQDHRLTNRVLLEQFRRGGLVSLSIHANNPVTGGPAWDSGCDLGEILRAGSAAQRNWMEQMAGVADGLAELRDAGADVLFRPFHEMNGGWFWWGGKEPEQYKALWRLTWEYLVVKRGLDHLLWVYSPSSQFDQLAYYPGGDVVDVVGFDAYTPNLPADAKAGYEQLLTLGKPFGLTEYGCVGGMQPPERPFDYSLLIRWIREDFPRTAFFIAWRDHWGLNQNANVEELLDDSWVVNLEDLPAVKAEYGLS
jgi:mannan endo-1,4-beta-mannosidase